MGQLWDLVQGWIDEQHRFPPSDRQVARGLGVSQSTLSGWRDGMTEVPRRRTLWAIHHLTAIPYRRIVDAAIEDAGLYDEKQAEDSWTRWKVSKGERLLSDESGDALEQADHRLVPPPGTQ